MASVKHSISCVFGTAVGLFAFCAAAQANQAFDTSPPKTATAMEFIEVFEKLSGAHPGFRKAHAKGVCAVGTFAPNADALIFAESPLFTQGELPASLRFSLGGGNPIADERVPGVRGVGIQISLPNGSKHTITGNSAPVFAGKDPETFLGLLKTFLPDENGKVDPSRTGAYIMANPSTQANAMWTRTTPAPSSWANTPYFGLHTFFYGEGSEQIKYRWHITPDLGVEGLSKEKTAGMPAAFLKDKLLEQVADENTVVSFSVMATIGEENDTNIDPSVRWPDDRMQIKMGTITVNSAGDGSCTNTNYDPNILSKGFTPSADPVLRMRSPAYGISFGKRLSGQ
ncbi:MAG: catalase family peroxidase [Glaciecola sp.]